MTGPCKDCKDRSVTCHSTCEKYLEFRKMMEEEYKKRKAAYDVGESKCISIQRSIRRRGK